MDFIGHYIIAVIIGLAVFGREDWKKIALFSLFALLPDFDFAFGLHRQLFHNIFFAIIAGLVVFLALKKLHESKALKYGFFAFLGVLSHLLLDLAKPGVALFWPFFQKGIFLEFYISIYPIKLVPYFEFGFSELSKKTLEFCCGMERAFLSDTTAFIIFVLAMALIAQGVKHRLKK